MIPLRDENPTRTTPVIVIALIIANVLMFLIDRLGAHGPVGALYEFRMVPQNIINEVRGVGPVAPTLQPVWLTIFTSMFMHANLLHIGGNMLYLWIFGNNIEDRVGHVKFVLFYLAGGFAAAAAHILSTAGNPFLAKLPTVGASGAVAAVLGAYLVLFPTARIICLVILGFLITTVAVPAIVVLLIWIALQIVSVSVVGGPGAMSGGVAYWAHIGGFFAGVIMIYLLGGKRLLGGRRRYTGYPEW
ncbi:MAG: rhomboid family intramembrane serine protease [Armatimonadota bacterium]|nr:rhomboid family intramembrane serine protease [Armatimonadota bacterium]